MVERRKSAGELSDQLRRRALENLRRQLLALRCPVTIIESHLQSVEKAIRKRAQRREEIRLEKAKQYRANVVYSQYQEKL